MEATTETLSPVVALHDQLLKPEEAARILNLSEGTLSGWRHGRKTSLKYILVNTAVRYRMSDLLEFMNSQTVISSQGPPPGMKQGHGGPGRPRRKRTVPKKRRTP